MKNNFKYGYDQSLSCYLTDFIWCGVTIYYCKLSYDKYINESDNNKLNNNELDNSQIKNIYLYLFLINVCISISCFLGGLTHLFFYKDKTIRNKLFWRLTIGFSSISSVMLISLILLLTFKIKSKIINIVNLVVCSLLFITEIVTDSIFISYFSSLSYILILLLSIPFLSGLKYDKNINEHSPKFISSMILFFIYTIIYIFYFIPRCGIPNANSKNCILPNWFNHNSVLHIIYCISYSLLNEYIIKEIFS